jgi:hypothetical protein
VKNATMRVEQADLRLVQKGPEVADHGGRQHHRDQDQRGPEAVAAELAVDQIGQRRSRSAFATRMVQNTKCAVACMAAHTSGSVRMDT